MSQELPKNLERLGFDVYRRAPHPQFAATLIQLAVGEPPDVAGRPAGVGSGDVIHVFRLL